MINFQQLDGPGGIPVYFQHCPVNSVSVYWLVFVGSADDETVGKHGIYHWFEHIPSRGTKKFPGGYRDTEARLVRHGGCAGAETDYDHTAYYACVPKRVWTTALDILTDMIAQPLLRDADVEAERDIIQQEIDEWHSSPYGEALCRLPGILFPGHPLGHDQLGSHESLDSMQPQTLRMAHSLGYDRSRCVLFVCGDLERQEVLDAVAAATENLPSSQAAERRGPISYGALPDWKGGRVTTVPTRHEDSAVFLLFPVASHEWAPERLAFLTVLEYLVTSGDLGSPLHHVVREKSLLAYSPEMISSITVDGGFWGLNAQSNCADPQQVVERFWEVLKSDELRSKPWQEFVLDTIRGEFDMRVPSPSDYTEEAAGRLTGYGAVWSDDEMQRRLLAVSGQDVAAYLDSLRPDDSHAIIFQGERAGAPSDRS